MSSSSSFNVSGELAPQAARLGPKLRALADRGIYFGTSSWKYDGWLGSIFSEDRYQTRGKFSKAKFEDTCLTEYAATFPTVCGDFAFHQFPTKQYWSNLFEATPSGFLFGFKVPEDITVSVWPKHARYGRRAGQQNEHFLNPEPFAQFFTGRLDPYNDQVAVLIFEFGTFNKSTFPTPGDFMARLDPFLAALPKGYRYAVEIRNPDYLSPAYFEMLAPHNTAHVFSAWTRMPALEEQAQLSDAYTADFTVVLRLVCNANLGQRVPVGIEEQHLRLSHGHNPVVSVSAKTPLQTCGKPTMPPGRGAPEGMGAAVGQGVSRISCQPAALTARRTIRLRRGKSVTALSCAFTDSLGGPNRSSPTISTASRAPFSWPSSMMAR
jgi:uncharacterized protein YecE (DUF72 family)